VKTGLDSGVFGAVRRLLCDWGITPVNSDDHIGVCISGSQDGKDTLKHRSLAFYGTNAVGKCNSVLSELLQYMGSLYTVFLSQGPTRDF
jgi:hypothetical protein